LSKKCYPPWLSTGWFQERVSSNI